MTDGSSSSAEKLEGPKLEALIEMMYLAAYADGDFGDEERAHFHEVVGALAKGQLPERSLGDLLKSIEEKVAGESRAARLASVKERLGEPRERQQALRVALEIMAADGIVRTSERELILEVAEALELDRDIAANLVREVTGG